MGLNNDDSIASKKQARGHLLLIPASARGHFPLFVQLLHILDAECPGLIVTLTASPDIVKDLAGYRSDGDFQNLDLRVEEIHGEAPRDEKDPLLARVYMFSDQHSRDTEALRTKLRAQIRNGTGVVPTAIISDMFIFWCKDFADELGIPWYTYFSCSPIWTLLGLEHSKVLKAGVDSRVAASREDDQFLLDAVPDHIPAPALSHLRVSDMSPQSFKHADFFVQVGESQAKAAGVIVNTAEELDAPSGVISVMKDLLGSSRVLCIGPSLYLPGFGHVQASEPTDPVFPWLDSQREKSVVYVAFGSTDSISREMNLELAAGLEATGVPFLWALKPGAEELSALLPEGFEERTSGRGLIATGWVSQTNILQHPAVGGFITHCGWNSTLESICCGVPLIAWPLSADQFVTARYLQDMTKTGITIASFKERNDHSFNGITRKEIELATKKVILEDEGRQLRINVEKMQKLATKAVQRGGSSYKNLHDLLGRIGYKGPQKSEEFFKSEHDNNLIHSLN